jgi:hypothetical protein
MELGTALTVSAGVGVLIALAVMATPMTIRYLQANSPQALQTASADAADQMSRDKIQAHVNALAEDGCQSRAKQVTTIYSDNPMMTKTDIPAALFDDLKLCLQRGIMFGYVKGALEERGIMRMIAAN